MGKQNNTGNFTLDIFVNSCNKMLRSIQSRILYLVQCPKSRLNRHAWQHMMSKDPVTTNKPIFTHLWESNLKCQGMSYLWSVRPVSLISIFAYFTHSWISSTQYIPTKTIILFHITKTFFWHLHKRLFWFGLLFPKNANKSHQYCITKILTI